MAKDTLFKFLGHTPDLRDFVNLDKLHWSEADFRYNSGQNEYTKWAKKNVIVIQDIDKNAAHE